MADNVVEQNAPQTETQQAEDYKAALADQMSIALNGNLPTSATNLPASEGVQSQTTEQTTPAPEATTPVEAFSILREKYQYQNPEDAVKEIEELRAFKAQPRLPEFQAANEESAAILKALSAGKREDVWKALDREMKIERLVNAEVNKDTAAEILRTSMQFKYQDFSPEEINYKFNKQYGLPPQPKQAAEELDEDFQSRMTVWQEQVTDKQMEMMIDAKLAKKELEGFKGKLEFPEIESPVDEGYIQYQKMLEDKAKSDQETQAAYKALNSKAIETKINFKDEANKIDFQFQFEPDAEGFAKAVDIACNADLFWQTFMNSDGSPNRQKFLDAIYYANNKEKVLMAAMNQAKNATIKASLPDNSQGGMLRQMPQTQEPNELDQNMKMALRGYI